METEPLYSKRAYRDVLGLAPRATWAARALFWFSAAVFGICAILGAVVFGFYFANVGSFIRTVTGVGPTNGEVTGVGGLGISVVPNVPGSVLTFNNDGVVTISSVTPDATGDLAIVGGNGVSVVPSPNTLTINSDGVTSLTAGYGLDGSSLTGDITLDHEITKAIVALPQNDPNGAMVAYMHAFGIAIPAVENTWRMGAIPGFFPTLLPGVEPGDDGQGNGGVTWTVPAIGRYDFNVHCVVAPSAREVGDHQSFTMAINLGATTVNPNLSGFIPQGGSTSLDISSSSPLGPTFPLRMSVSGSVQAGCTGCSVAVGNALTVHIRQDHFGVGAAVTFMVACRIQVSRSV